MTRCILFSALVFRLVFVAAIPAVNASGLPGAYAPVELTEDVKMAADFAVREEAKREAVTLKLATISKAEKQIVAGINFRLTLEVNRGGSRRAANVVVFRDLKSRYQLTSWKWLGD